MAEETDVEFKCRYLTKLDVSTTFDPEDDIGDVTDVTDGAIEGLGKIQSRLLLQNPSLLHFFDAFCNKVASRTVFIYNWYNINYL